MKKGFAVLFFTLMLLWPSGKAEAVCKANPAQLVTIMTSTCYSCMLPLRIAGITILQGPMPDPMGSVGSPICICNMPPPLFVRIGIPVSFFEPSRLIDVVKDPYCFAGLGFGLGLNPMQGGTKGDAISKSRTFFQAHYYIFPLYAILELMTDFICLETTGFDVAYITEVDPLWNDDMLSAIINPEALLFGNPITNMACIADSVAAQINAPLDPLFWCKGSWGNAYPLTGNTNTKDYVEDSASVAASIIYKLHRQLILWGSWGQLGLCGYYPAPIWRKSAYRMQIMAPIPHPIATGIGQSGLLWSYGKNIPFVGDNFNYLLFKKRECCAF
ncbi:TraU family protein [Nitrosophilus labii]|uniref:TraU family protein n=1 Tax=Nitrosophilus labii TaxID=2706014 RepID=UPI00165728B2|nr:TraU family protein [Nitrosophilus labii]